MNFVALLKSGRAIATKFGLNWNESQWREAPSNDWWKLQSSPSVWRRSYEDDENAPCRYKQIDGNAIVPRSSLSNWTRTCNLIYARFVEQIHLCVLLRREIPLRLIFPALDFPFECILPLLVEQFFPSKHPRRIHHSQDGTGRWIFTSGHSASGTRRILPRFVVQDETSLESLYFCLHFGIEFWLSSTRPF